MTENKKIVKVPTEQWGSQIRVELTRLSRLYVEQAYCEYEWYRYADRALETGLGENTPEFRAEIREDFLRLWDSEDPDGVMRHLGAWHRMGLGEIGPFYTPEVMGVIDFVRLLLGVGAWQDIKGDLLEGAKMGIQRVREGEDNRCVGLPHTRTDFREM